MKLHNDPIFTEDEIQQLRNETTAAQNITHFNNAGASLPPDIVVNSVIEYLQTESLTGGYEMEEIRKNQIENTYVQIARLINAEPGEIAMTENASTAWALAFNGVNFQDGDEIITSEMEYVTNLLGFLQLKKNKQITIKTIPFDKNGEFMIEELQKAITAKTKLIAITHIASSNGLIMPVKQIGDIARRAEILYLVDACQSVGHIPVDVKQIQCDMLSATGRKYLRAPRGTGFLYVRQSAQSKIKPLYIDFHSIQSYTASDFVLRDDARRYEVFEKSRALTVGLGKAAEYALKIGIDRISQRIFFLAGILRKLLMKIEGVTVHDFGAEQSGIVTFSVKGFNSADIKKELGKKNMNVSIGNAAATLIFMEKNNLDNILRASMHYYNTESEVLLFCEAIKAITGANVLINK